MLLRVAPETSWACCDPNVPSRATSSPIRKVSGNPLWMVVIPVNVQPPSRVLATLLENLIGGDHKPEATKAWRRSQSERPRSSLRLKGLATVAPKLSVELLSIDFE